MNNTKDLDPILGFQNNFLLLNFTQDYLFEKKKDIQDPEKIRELAVQVCARIHLSMKLIHDNLLLHKHEHVHKKMKEAYIELETMLKDLIEEHQITADEIENICEKIVSDKI